MPTFDTPDPIHLTLEINVGDVRIVASDRRDTVVAVRPSNPDRKSDVAAAANTHVQFANGELVVRAPKGWRQFTPRGGGDSIDVQIEVPTASRLRASAGIAPLHCAGRLGDCRYKAGVGEIHIEEAATVDLRSGMGDIAVDRAVGDVHVSAGSGTARIGSVTGAAVVKDSNGDIWIGDVSGDLRVSAANGTIVIDHAGATVAAKTAYGDVRIGEVASGAIVAQTACGKVDIGIRDGVAAWLDLNTSFGNVRNELADAPPPGSGDASVEVRGRTAFGDITIRRSAALAAAVAP
jgi:hypothetical protein